MILGHLAYSMRPPDRATRSQKAFMRIAQGELSALYVVLGHDELMARTRYPQLLPPSRNSHRHLDQKEQTRWHSMLLSVNPLRIFSK